MAVALQCEVFIVVVVLHLGEVDLRVEAGKLLGILACIEHTANTVAYIGTEDAEHCCEALQWVAVAVEEDFIQECEAVEYYVVFHHAVWGSIIAVDLHEALYLAEVDPQCITIKVRITKALMVNR